MSETTIPACSGRSRRIHTKKCASADKQAGMRIPIRMAEGLILKSSPAPDHHGAAIRSDRDLRPLNRGIPVDHARTPYRPVRSRMAALSGRLLTITVVKTPSLRMVRISTSGSGVRNEAGAASMASRHSRP